MGIQQWKYFPTPSESQQFAKEILNCNEKGSGIIRFLIAADGMTIWAIIRRGDRNGISQGGAQLSLYRSVDRGISWSDEPYNNLVAAQKAENNYTLVWDMAIAPDDPDIIAVACANIKNSPLAQGVFVSTDKGKTWNNTKWPPKGVKQGVT